MEFTNNFIFFGGLLLGLSIFAGSVSSRIGAPLLLVFLGVGMLFGEDGLGGIVFNDMPLSFTVCSLALALVLFDGGLRTSVRDFRLAFKPALSLATLGVVVTASILGFGVWYFLALDAFESFLIGATVASTDAAAVFLLLHARGVKLAPRLTATLEVESGLNDPVAVLLTVGTAQLILDGASHSGLELLGHFLREMGIGAAVGYAGGICIARLLDRVNVLPGLYPILAIAGALLVFGGTSLLGGSGFLAVYLSGVIVGSAAFRPKRVVQQFMDGLAWLSQMVMLLILGLLVTPTKLIPDLPIALVAGLVLMFVARPLAVWLCLAFSRFNWREKLFISWVGLRGAVPIYLAIIPSLLGVQNGYQYFNVAFIVVIFSLLLQGWTLNVLARWLNLEGETEAVPAA